MRIPLLVVGVVAVAMSGCRHVPKIVVPQTPEGLACLRDCMVVYNTCVGGRGRNEKVCHTPERECLMTCPGATFEDGTPTLGAKPPGGVPPAESEQATPREVDPSKPQPSCIAAELPEWKGADAATKKALMERCRVPTAGAPPPDAGQ